MEILLKILNVSERQTRKYTGNPYEEHLAEVVGIASAAWWRESGVRYDVFLATCWLHDCVEDQGVSRDVLADKFGSEVAYAVVCLSNTESGNRAERKMAERIRLSEAAPWIQTIKCADVVSNGKSIAMYVPGFAKVYLREKLMLMGEMGKADPRLRLLAMQLVEDGLAQVVRLQK